MEANRDACCKILTNWNRDAGKATKISEEDELPEISCRRIQEEGYFISQLRVACGEGEIFQVKSLNWYHITPTQVFNSEG